MKAIVQNAYGSSEVLSIKNVKKPEINENEILIRVHASSVNAGDYFSMIGSPYLARFMVGFPKPKNYILGWDVSGIVENVGENVSRIIKGDEVYASVSHAFAEYVSTTEDLVALKPSNLTFEQAAAVPTAAITALQGLRDKGLIKKGQKVLINGASGGVGSFAVQIAKSYGAMVTGVCSGKNKDLVLSLGADHVIDYSKEDFTKGNDKYDLILDNVGNRSFSDLRSALSSSGIVIPNSGYGGMSYVIKAFILSPFYKNIAKMYLANPNNKDLELIKEHIESGRIKPVIDKSYSFKDIAKAFDHIGSKHARGKIVIKI